MKLIRQGGSRWVYVLPIIHFLACFSIFIAYLIPYAGIFWTFILVLDLPISLVYYGLAWRNGFLAAIWIFVVGTLWWYLLSRGIELLYNNFINRGPAEQPLIPKGN
jgi:hypothetical protein